VSGKPELRRSTRRREPIDRWVSTSIAIASQFEIQQSDVSDAFTYVDIDDECMNAYTSQFDEFTGLMDYADPSVYSYLNDRARLHMSESIIQDNDAVVELYTIIPEHWEGNTADVHTRPSPKPTWQNICPTMWCKEPFPRPAVFTSVLENDTFNYHTAMLQPDWEQFQKAAVLQIETLQKMRSWQEVERYTVPVDKQVLGGTWVFRRKRNPEGKVIKYKARFCVRGDQQIAGVDYFESYAPVTMWYTVRMMLILSILYDWYSVQIDYTNAFAQAFLKEVVYMEVPKGFSAGDKDIVLLLLKSLYGLVQAPKTFYDLLTSQLTRVGYVSQPSIDPCLWIHPKRKIICVIWVDDCLFFGADKKQIHQSIDELKQNMPLTMEESVTAFLGIKVERNSNGYKLSQPGLTTKIIESLDMVDCNPCKTPAEKAPIGTDALGPRHNEKWEYSSVVGMLMFLANNTRPDIAYATHQCARFSHSPKASHSLAVKKIARYLKGTPNEGIIMKPKRDLTIDCYVDADFAGLYGSEDSQDPICAKSRTGYVLFLADCPLMWVSKLQTEIASSTMEAEYIALSQSMRDLIPVRRLLQSVCDLILPEQSQNARMYSSVFEDNNGALQLARAPRITPRTKHYAIKYHFFRDNVTKGDIKLFKVESSKQRADIFTKGLVQQIFEIIRKLLMGW
jgi:Reverse transcriptase (RNA-dependent DNA polymerase)